MIKNTISILFFIFIILFINKILKNNLDKEANEIINFIKESKLIILPYDDMSYKEIRPYRERDFNQFIFSSNDKIYLYSKYLSSIYINDFLEKKHQIKKGNMILFKYKNTTCLIDYGNNLNSLTKYKNNLIKKVEHYKLNKLKTKKGFFESLCLDPNQTKYLSMEKRY